MIGGRDYCGTGAGVRNMGFVSPAAGKTGTEHDAWFAGFTTNLLCIVWVGNDDYTDLKIEGAHAAAPIWAAFMKKAVQLPQYSDTHEFTPPDGVEIVSSGQGNQSAEPTRRARMIMMPRFSTARRRRILATIPPDHRNILQKIFGIGKTERN